MNLSSLRSAFQLAVSMRDHELMGLITTEIKKTKYGLKSFESLPEVVGLKSGWVPHIVLLNLSEHHDSAIIEKFKAENTETKFIGVFSPLSITVSGQVLVPLMDGLCRAEFSGSELLLALDRLAQVIYLEQINETLITDNETLRANAEVMDELNKVRDEERREVLNVEAITRLLTSFQGVIDHREAIENYFDWFGGRYKNAKIIWFNFVQRHHAFTATTGRNISQSLRGLGFKVSKNHLEILNRDAVFEELLELQDFVKSLFGPESFGAHPVFVKGSLIGLMVVIGDDSLLRSERQTANLSMLSLKNYLDLLYHRDRLYQFMEYDLELGILDRKSFQKHMINEVHRSRKNHFPVSLLLLGFERDLNNKVSKALTRLIIKELRPYDTIGVWGKTELAILLPHTSNPLAASKADSLLKMLNSVKVVGSDYIKAKSKVSIGISEHPSCATDAEELGATANEALLESQKSADEQIVLAALVNQREATP